jgi:Protein of unknown function (DUF4232)
MRIASMSVMPHRGSGWAGRQSAGTQGDPMSERLASRWRATTTAVGLTAVVGLLAGCLHTTATGAGRFAGAPSGLPAVSAPSSSPTLPASAPGGSPTSTGGGAPTAPNIAGCTVRHVKVTHPDPSQGAAGTIVQRFVMTNTGTQPCTMDRYPFISAYGPTTQGGTKVEATLNVPVGTIPPTFGQFGKAGGEQTIAPSGVAVFFMKWSQVPTGDAASCPQADGFDFRPPNDAQPNDQELITYGFTPCEIEVSQVFASSMTY